ncbi:hypothetical protein GXP67_01260 [Rhodocytophaga rosea]|uniref:Uncharacterized protein n=1 Tax=Rhodocytophaga rosea TaxID=2704465 RepID=A0A6C0GBP8_9BACT|nr:hypothetical protein [Rhodocytophaga rosea]QHT65399.1 hypothetical protein GXP67_01260 [Rhodocytophaga rosea]
MINTVSQVIQSASKIINSEAFKQAKKALEKLKEIEGGVQQFRRIQETVEFIQSSTQSYKQALSVIAEDRHFSPKEIASFYSGLEKLAKQDAKLLDDLSAGIKANVVEMNSSERMQFIMKIHGEAAASAARLKAFVGGIEYLSLRRSRTKKDRLATMQLYALSRNANFAGTVSQVDFGFYTGNEVDIEKLEKEGRTAANEATKEQMEWLTDPNNPQAKENAIKNILNDPMPQRPEVPGKKATAEEVQRYFELNHVYNDRLENWQTNHKQDLEVLGQDKASFVINKPATLTDKEWMEVIVNKLRKGQL